MRSAYDPSAVRSGSVFSDNPNYAMAWICYINGIETPILGFNISTGVWQPPQFEIHVAPDVTLQGLGREDRIPVALFYLDPWNNPENPEPRLLVDGEIRGYRSRRANGNRVMSFICMSHINVFEKLYFFFMNTVDDIVAAQSPEIRTQGFTGQGLFYPYSLFHQGLFVNQGEGREPAVGNDIPDTVPTSGQGDMVKTAHEIHYNVIKGIIASAPTVPDDKRSLPMMNFFARHTRKTRLHHRFVRLPVLEDVAVVNERKGVFPIFAGVRADEALTAMQHQVAGRIGNSGSIWDMLKQIYGLVYMEFAAIPNPAAVRTNMEGEILGPVAERDDLIEQRPNMSPPAAISTGSLLLDNIDQVSRTPVVATGPIGSDPASPIRLAQYFAKPQFLFGIPPHCNVFFPSMIEDLTYGSDYGEQPTRIYVNDSVMSRVLNAHGPNREFMLHALTVAYPEEADAVMHSTVPNGEAATGNLHETGKNLLIWPEEFYKGPVTAKMELPSWFQTMMQFLNASETGDATAAVNSAGPTAPTISPTVSSPTPNVVIPPSSGRGRSYRNGTPEVYVREKASRALSHWNGELGRAIRTMAPIIFGDSVPGELFLGFAMNGNQYENTSTSSRPAPFHEVGFFGVEAGLRTGPAPNPDPTAPYSNWARCATDPLVRQAIGAVEGAPRNASLTEGGWRALNDQVAVGLLNLKHARRGVAQRLTAQGIDTRDDNSQWSMILMLAAWSGGVGGATRMVTHPAIKAAIAQAPVDRRWGVAVRALSEAGTAGTVPPVQARAHNINRFYEMTRCLQKVEVGRVVAASSGNLAWFDDGLGAARTQLHDRLAYYGYVPQPGQVPQRNRPSAASVTQTRDDTDTVGASNEPARAVVNATPQRQVTRVTTGAVTPPGSVAAGGTADRGSHDTTPTTTTTTTSSAPTDAAATELPPNQKFAEIFRLYAQYEFLRQRYSQNNGAVSLKFNPYVVAGFPCVAFDRASTSEHVVGYVYTVNHSAMGNSMGTSVGLTCVRTLPEFLNDVRNDCERFSERVVSAPAEMIPEIRRVIQNEDQSELFYQRLFYGGARPGNLPAAFHFDRALGYTRGLNVEPISIQGTETERVENDPNATANPDGSFNPGTVTMTERSVTHNIDPNESLTPLPNTIYADAFDNHHIAMQLAARNVCTLTEYIRFWHGGRALGDLISSGDVEGIESDYAYGSVVETDVVAEGTGSNGQRQVTVGQATRYTGVFYKRIYKLRQGPGRPPNEQERGYTGGGTPSGATSGVPADYPQTRADWDSVLLAYREKIRSRVTPST